MAVIHKASFGFSLGVLILVFGLLAVGETYTLVGFAQDEEFYPEGEDGVELPDYDYSADPESFEESQPEPLDPEFMEETEPGVFDQSDDVTELDENYP